MGDTFIYHPGTDATVAVPEESVWHYRQGGWLTRAEWVELQELDAVRLAEAEKAAAEAEKPVVTARTPVAAKKE
jgi:hypothetical protein